MVESIQKEDLKNKSLPITIQRGKHNKENPYVMISKKMLSDTELSPKAKGVLCYLLSMCDNWTTHPRQIAQALGVGKDQIYTVLRELLKTGYAYKTPSQNSSGIFIHVVYEFYEEKLPPERRFKEKSTVSGFQDTEASDTKPCLDSPYLDSPYPGTQTLIKNDLNEDILEIINTPPTPKIDKTAIAERVCVSSQSKAKKNKFQKFNDSEKPLLPIEQISTEAKELFPKFIKVLKDHDKNYIIKNELLIHNSLHEMLELGREADFILSVFSWGIRDNIKRGDWEGWSKLLLGADDPAGYLAVKFQKVASSMNVKVVRKFNASSNQEATLKILQEMDKRAL